MTDDRSSPRRRGLREFTMAAAVVVSLLGGAAPAGSAPSSKNGRFAYVAGSPASIWVMNANGSGRKVVAPHYRFASVEREDSEPDWSPKGTEIAFTRSRQTTGPHGSPEPMTEIDVMNADGSSQTRLTRTAMNDHSPAWSPDGKKIAFVRDRIVRRDGQRYPYTGEIYVMNANGSGQTRLTHVALNACSTDTNIEATQPAWSPDGKKIAFTSVGADYPCNHEIHVMNADGSGQAQLTGSSGPEDVSNASYPAWSPDGKKIAFQSDSPATPLEVYVMNADGSEQTRLTKNDGFCPYGCPSGERHGRPAWSPDGKKIAFIREIPSKTVNQQHLFDLFAMNADGSRPRLVQHQIYEIADWGPVPSGAPNPLRAPPLKIITHPSLTLRCLNNVPGSSPGQVLEARVDAPSAGIDLVKLYFNGRYSGYGNTLPVFTREYVSQLPKTTWIVKAVISVETESSVVELVLTKRHAPHC